MLSENKEDRRENKKQKLKRRPDNEKNTENKSKMENKKPKNRKRFYGDGERMSGKLRAVFCFVK